MKLWRNLCFRPFYRLGAKVGVESNIGVNLLTLKSSCSSITILKKILY